MHFEEPAASAAPSLPAGGALTTEPMAMAPGLPAHVADDAKPGAQWLYEKEMQISSEIQSRSGVEMVGRAADEGETTTSRSRAKEITDLRI